MRPNKIILTISVIALLSSCRSFTDDTVNELVDRYSYDISALEKNYNVIINGKPNGVISENKYDLQIKTSEKSIKSSGLGGISGLLSVMTLGAYVFTGVPLDYTIVTSQATASIMSKQKNKIKALETSADDREWMAMYWGYDFTNTHKKALLVSTLEARNQVLKLVEEYPLEDIKKLDAEDKKNIEQQKRKKALENKKAKEAKAQKEKKAKEAKAKALAERLARLKEKFSDEEFAAILQNKIYLGMSEDGLLESWEKPEYINKDVGSWGVKKQYVYYGDYVYVTNGKITSYSVKKRSQ